MYSLQQCSARVNILAICALHTLVGEEMRKNLKVGRNKDFHLAIKKQGRN